MFFVFHMIHEKIDLQTDRQMGTANTYAFFPRGKSAKTAIFNYRIKGVKTRISHAVTCMQVQKKHLRGGSIPLEQ